MNNEEQYVDELGEDEPVAETEGAPVETNDETRSTETPVEAGQEVEAGGKTVKADGKTAPAGPAPAPGQTCVPAAPFPSRTYPRP